MRLGESFDYLYYYLNMGDLKKNFLERLYRHPWLIVIVIAAITIFFAIQLPKAELDNNNIRFIPDDDEARMTSQYIDETFDSSLFILVALERKYGDVFDAAFLNRIREFNSLMEEFEIVGNVNSIVSSDYIYAEGDSIIVRKIAGEEFTGSAAEIGALKQKLLSWDIYRRALISDDFRATQILIPLTITTEMASRPEVIDSFIEIRDIAKDMFADCAEVYVTGLPIISAAINEAMSLDLKTMIPLVALVVLLVLFFSFRKFAYIALPLVTVVVASIWSMGAMPLFGVKLSVISTVLPVILVAVGSAYGIHVVTHYSEDIKEKWGAGTVISREEHRDLILEMIGRIGKAVLLAAMTTLAGFSSFCFTKVAPIREFGYFSTFGVLVSFITAIALIPSLLIIRGPGHIKQKKGAGASSSFLQSDFGIAAFFARIARRKGIVIFCVLVIGVFTVIGLSKVIMDNVFVEYFKASSDMSRSDKYIREKFGGSKVVSVVVQADSSERLLMPDVLTAMDGLGKYLEGNVSEVGKILGFTDLVKRINQVFNADESPDGLSPSASSYSNSGNFGFDDFGFGSFGFDEFGFGSFDDGNFADHSSPASQGVSDASQSPREKYLNTISADDLVSLLRQAASSGDSRSMDANSLIREMERLINYEGASYYEIPSDPARYGKMDDGDLQRLIANYLILLSGNIRSYANDPLSPTAIKTTIQLRTLGNEDTGRALNQIRGFIADNFPKDINAIVGGSALVEDSLNYLVVQSQLISVITSIMIVFFILTFSYRSLFAGIIGIVPLSICILVNFAVMGFSGIKLNIGTSMVASVSVGIGIDYTIHYIEAFRREFLAAKGQGDFLLKTFESSGKAIIINAVSVGAGFAVLLFSQFIMMKDLGLLIALTMCSSALASLTLIPVLLSVFKPKFVWRLQDE